MKRIITAAAALLLLSACHRDNNTTTSNPNDKTHIQFVSASPSEQHPDLYLLGSSSPQVADFYYYLPTGYDQPRIGDLTVTIKDGAHGTVLTSGPLACSKDSFYTWFLYDTFPNLKAYMTTDVRLASIPSDKAAVKFVNLCPNGGNLHYRVQGHADLTTDLGYAGTSPATSTTQYLLMDTGWQNIEVVNSSSVVVSTFQNFYARTGAYYTLWTTGYIGGTGDYVPYTGWTEDH